MQLQHGSQGNCVACAHSGGERWLKERPVYATTTKTTIIIITKRRNTKNKLTATQKRHQTRSNSETAEGFYLDKDERLPITTQTSNQPPLFSTQQQQ